MSSSGMAEATKIYESLKAEFSSSKPNLDKCGQLLTQAKIALTQLNCFLLPSNSQGSDPPSSQVVQQMLLAREILEIGALYSIRVREIPSFERYHAQLMVYYSDFSKCLTDSPRHQMIRGLHLLSLLAQNRIAEFHTALELVPSADFNTPYIKHAVQLEQAIMEGSYNKVWHGRHSMPAPECGLFLNMLMVTIRNEIANCAEKCYSLLPVQDVANLMFFESREEAIGYARERGDSWKVLSAEDVIKFASLETIDHNMDAKNVTQNALFYARELERIV